MRETKLIWGARDALKRFSIKKKIKIKTYFLYKNKIKNKNCLIDTMETFFASRPRARPVGALGIFVVPHWKDCLPLSTL